MPSVAAHARVRLGQQVDRHFTILLCNLACIMAVAGAVPIVAVAGAVG